MLATARSTEGTKMTKITMNRQRFSTLLIVATLVGAAMTAQSKLDLQSRSILRNERNTIAKMRVDARTKSLTKVKNQPSSYIAGFIMLNDGETADCLTQEGVEVLSVRGNIALCAMPVADVERISELPQVKRVELSREAQPMMDKVRSLTGADKIHQGEGDLTHAYTGKGVLTGIVDGGLDPNHINFKKEDGSHRISYLTHIYLTSTNQQGYKIDEYYTPEKLSSFTTDTEESFHGTHTLGIMAGGYKGNLTLAKQKNSWQADVVEEANPYYGMAPDADIVASCGTLADVFIAYGIEGILDYRYYYNKPAVINLSLGNNTGPHDGTSVICQYLTEAAKEAIICIAAGNSGNNNIVLTKNFTANDTKTKTFIQSISEVSGYHNLRYGQVYAYSADDSEFTIKAVIYNKKRGTTTFELPISSNTDGVSTYYSSPEYAEEGDKSHVNFTKAFDGYVGMGSMYDEDNGRYYVLIDYMLSDNQTSNADGNYVFGIVAEGADGQRVDCYCDGAFSGFSSFGIDGWEEGTADGSVSNMATANDVIVVGAYNIRDSWPSLDGHIYSYQGQYPEGQISDFSSYGTLIDGRQLPHVCAPGTTVISSANLYYCEDPNYEMTDGEFQARLSGSDRNHHWFQSLGTSMACPVVAGGIALWLEADPTLDVHDVKDIIAATSVKDEAVLAGNQVQWGAGKFDAYAGLKEVIRRSTGVADAMTDNNRLMVTAEGGNCFNAFVGGATAIDAAIYSLSGQKVLGTRTEGDEITVDASSLAPGCYILKVNNQSQKIIVK